MDRQCIMIIVNTARIAIFAALAVLFKTWWIVLLSILFLVYEKSEKQ